LAKAFIAVDISLNGCNFELKRKLAHGNTAKSQDWCPTFRVQSRYGVALAFDLDLPRRKAERRFCAVGNPAWMPG
ncbi:hypothetical protein, partial [Pseudomonas fluorescens]|uniref:hypothetical protein n=1 Tax=Pseudomonas fluorescens TaxID=294 RepID=UPI001C5749D7